jgi:hypothetical protein
MDGIHTWSQFQSITSLFTVPQKFHSREFETH